MGTESGRMKREFAKLVTSPGAREALSEKDTLTPVFLDAAKTYDSREKISMHYKELFQAYQNLQEAHQLSQANHAQYRLEAEMLVQDKLNEPIQSFKGSPAFKETTIEEFSCFPEPLLSTKAWRDVIAQAYDARRLDLKAQLYALLKRAYCGTPFVTSISPS